MAMAVCQPAVLSPTLECQHPKQIKPPLELRFEVRSRRQEVGERREWTRKRECVKSSCSITTQCQSMIRVHSQERKKTGTPRSHKQSQRRHKPETIIRIMDYRKSLRFAPGETSVNAHFHKSVISLVHALHTNALHISGVTTS